MEITVPDPSEVLSTLFEAMGGGKFVSPETIMRSAQETTARGRGKAFERYLLLTLLNDRNSMNVLNRFRNSEADLLPPNSPDDNVFDFALPDRVEEDYPISLDSLVGLDGLLITMMNVKGYSDYSRVKGAIGDAVSPAVLSMIGVLGAHEWGVFVQNPQTNRLEKRELTYTLSDLLGAIAYKPKSTQLYLARHGSGYAGAVLNLQAELVGRSLELDLASEDPNTRRQQRALIKGAEVQTLNGERVRGFKQLDEILMGLPFAAEAFLNTHMDTVVYAQHVEAGVSQEHARAEFGALYYGDYAMCDYQQVPELHNEPYFPGVIEQYAGKGGLDWLFEIPGITSDKLEEEGVPQAEIPIQRKIRELRRMSLKEVFFYVSKFSEADLVESRAFQDFASGAIGINEAQQRFDRARDSFPSLPSKRLTPPEFWVSQFRKILGKEFRSGNARAQGRALWENVDLSSWFERVLEGSAGQGPNTGVQGAERLFGLMAEKGVGIFGWDKFDSRLVGDIFRYGERVAATSEALKESGNKLNGSGGTLTIEERKRYSPKDQLMLVSNRLEQIITEAVEILVRAKPNLFAPRDTGEKQVYMRNFLQGVIRANMVPHFKDRHTLLVDIDYDAFKKSDGAKKIAKRIYKKELFRDIDQQKQHQLEQLMIQNRCRWSKDKNGNEFLVGSSGRRLYLVATAKEQYDSVGKAISEMPNQESKTVINLKRRHKAVVKKGHNRFSIAWLSGNTPMGSWMLVDSPSSLVEQMENAGLISSSEKEEIARYVHDQCGPGTGTSYRDSAEKLVRSLGLNLGINTLGATKDPALPLAPPEYFRPDKYGISTGRI